MRRATPRHRPPPAACGALGTGTAKVSWPLRATFPLTASGSLASCTYQEEQRQFHSIAHPFSPLPRVTAITSLNLLSLQPKASFLYA